MAKKYLLILLISLISNSSAILSGAINWYFQFGITASVFFVAGLLYTKFSINKYIYILIICFPFLFYTSYTIYNLFFHVFPIALIPYFALLLGFYISKSKRPYKTKIRFSVLYLFLVICFSVFGMPNYLSYIFYSEGLKIETQTQYIQDFDLYDANLKKVELCNMKGKIIVLDFWTTSCGICYRKFPEFEKLADYFSTSDNICFFAVNILTKRDSLQNVIQQSKELGYKFQFLFTNETEVKSIQKKINVFSFPTIIIINKEGKIVYHGSLITNDLILFHNTKRTIEKLLK